MRVDHDLDAPPPELSEPLAALWWLARGGFAGSGADWERAHELCQRHEGEPGHDLAHAVVHLAEGDLPNARYWFRRAGRGGASDDTRGEWEAAVRALGG
jgi:uncharacterized Zn finger protein